MKTASGRKVRTPIAATSQEPRRKGNAPGNARGLRRAFREGETRGRGHGKCHRKYTAGVIRTLRQAHGKTADSPSSVRAHLARVKRWGKSPPPGWRHSGHGKPRVEQGQIGGEGWPGPYASRSQERGALTLG